MQEIAQIHVFQKLDLWHKPMVPQENKIENVCFLDVFHSFVQVLDISIALPCMFWQENTEKQPWYVGFFQNLKIQLSD